MKIIRPDGKNIDTDKQREEDKKPKYDSADLIREEREGYEFEITPKMQEYIDIRKLTGPPVFLSTDSEQHNLVKEFNTWVKAGYPKPEPPKLMIEEDPIPWKFYRTRLQGHQKFFWVDHKGVKHGKTVEERPIYANYTVTNNHGTQYQEVIGRRQVAKYTIDYKEDLVKKLIDDAMLRCPEPTFYFVIDDPAGNAKVKWSVKVEDFTGNFDEFLEAHRRRIEL